MLQTKQCSAGTIRTDQQIYRMLGQTKIQEDKYPNII